MKRSRRAERRRNTCRDGYNKFYRRRRTGKIGNSTVASKKVLALCGPESEEAGGEVCAKQEAGAELVQRMG